MDPVMLPMILHSLEPIVGVLIAGSIPVGILWVIKHHQLRMKELEVESQRYASPGAQQLAAIEARLGAIEKAIGAPAPARNLLQERAALLESPPAAAEPSRVR